MRKQNYAKQEEVFYCGHSVRSSDPALSFYSRENEDLESKMNVSELTELMCVWAGTRN